MKHEKVFVLPCSGIGKVYGLLSREAAQNVVLDLEPNSTELICLASLLLDEIKEPLKNRSVICIDGCPKCCAEKSSLEAGMKVEKKYLTSQFMKKYRGEDPGTGSVLTEVGDKIATEIAKTIQEDVRVILQNRREE